MLPIPHTKFTDVSISPHQMDVLNPKASNVMIQTVHGQFAMGIPDALSGSLADLHLQMVLRLTSSPFTPLNSSPTRRRSVLYRGFYHDF